MSDAISRLFEGATRLEPAGGEYLFRAGDPVRRVFLVERGRVQLQRFTAAGARLILQEAGPGTVLAEASVYSERYHCDAVAAVPARLRALPREGFRQGLAGGGGAAELWARRLARGVQAARMRAEIRSLPRVADRLDAWLEAGNDLPEKGRWQDVAAELGVSREALYRELSRRRGRQRPSPGSYRANERKTT